MSLLGRIANMLFGDVRSAVDVFVREIEDVFKERVRAVLVTCVIIGFLSALAFLMLGSASILLLIGSVKYLSTTMPVWEAWETAGLIAGFVGLILLFALFIVTRKRLNSL